MFGPNGLWVQCAPQQIGRGTVQKNGRWDKLALKQMEPSSSSSGLFYLTTRKTPNKNMEQKQWPKNRLQRQNDVR